jgi:phosphoribosylanthranilate isomerase
MAGVKVKICGLRRARDVAAAVEHGADALGFVFAPSPRRIDTALAARLTAGVPDGIMRVGVFLDPGAEDVQCVLDQVALDLLQFHGDESDTFCSGFGRPWIKALSMRHPSVQELPGHFPGASGFLLDTHVPGGQGGTGHVFDWSASIVTDRPIWLAGGLNPGNVAEAVRVARPWAVDVSSGVEASPGIKDPRLIREFIFNARQE